MKTCVQIGLNMTAEYLYLVDNSLTTPEICSLLQSFQEGEWTYYGVDANPASIVFVANKYVHLNRSHLVCCKIAADTGLEAAALFWGKHIWAENMSIKNLEKQSFFVGTFSLGNFLSALELKYVDLLAIDVEGEEFTIFENYDWNVKPERLRVEVHCWDKKMEKANTFVDMVVSQGYEVEGKFNWNIEHVSKHVHFVHTQ